MATVHPTGKSRTGRHRAASTPKFQAEAGLRSHGAVKLRDYLLPSGLIEAVEEQRMALGVALTLLTSLDATLQEAEEGGGDLLDEEDAADRLVLEARAIARPVHLVRLAIERVYRAQAGLDSLYLERAARVAKGG